MASFLPFLSRFRVLKSGTFPCDFLRKQHTISVQAAKLISTDAGDSISKWGYGVFFYDLVSFRFCLSHLPVS